MNLSFARKGMVSNESKYIDEKPSLEMQMFLAENPELQDANTIQHKKGRSPPKGIVFEDQVYAKTSAEAANKMLLPR